MSMVCVGVCVCLWLRICMHVHTRVKVSCAWLLCPTVRGVLGHVVREPNESGTNHSVHSVRGAALHFNGQRESEVEMLFWLPF